MTRPDPNDIPMRRVWPLLVLLLAAVAMVLVVVAALSRLWDVEATPEWPGQASLEGKEPALETAPQPALRDYLASKRRILDSYGWVDPAHELARIPIGAAMRALASDGALPPGAARPQYLMGADRMEASP